MPLGNPTGGRLEQHRREVESIDRSLVLLLAARLAAAQRAIAARSEGGGPIADREQERRVIDRGHRWARQFGVPEELVDRLFRTMIEEGKARFRRSESGPEPDLVTVLVDAPAVPLRRSGDADPVYVSGLR